MKRTINYAGMPRDEQRAKVLRDCEAYLGVSAYKKVMKALKAEKARGADEDYLILGLSMLVGIEGLPARVMIEEA